MPEQSQMSFSAAQRHPSRLSSHQCLPKDDPKLEDTIYFYCWQCSSKFCCSSYLSEHQYEAHRTTDFHSSSQTGIPETAQHCSPHPEQQNNPVSDLEFPSRNSQEVDSLGEESFDMIPSDWDSLLEILNDSGLWDKGNSSCRLIVPAPAAIHTENWQSPRTLASRPRESSIPMRLHQMLNTPPPDSQENGLTAKGL